MVKGKDVPMLKELSTVWWRRMRSRGITPLLLTLALDEDESSLLGRFTHGEKPAVPIG
jgi:hypothetical protein